MRPFLPLIAATLVAAALPAAAQGWNAGPWYAPGSMVAPLPSATAQMAGTRAGVTSQALAAIAAGQATVLPGIPQFGGKTCTQNIGNTIVSGNAPPGSIRNATTVVLGSPALVC